MKQNTNKMKNRLVILFTLLLLTPKQTAAQNEGAAAAAIIGAGLAIGAGIAAVKQMEERAELTATQWILSNNPELSSFSLKTLSFDGRRQVLFGFTSQGWINDYGIDFNKVRWFLVDDEEWMNMMISYVKVSSNENNDVTLKENLKNGKVVNKGVKVNLRLTIPFYKLDGDMYLVADYSPDMKLIYNERSLGIFLKETRNLVQIGRGDIIDIHEFFFH